MLKAFIKRKSMKELTYNEALEYIHSRPKMKKADAHKGIKALLNYLDNPQDKLKFIHIAGTNGKGSCASMTASVLKTAGYKTGLNISPFIIDFTERFSINGKYIPKDILAKLTTKIKYYQEEVFKNTGIEIVEFEIVTALAFMYFEMENCDIVCLEVGIGGRLDTTNVIKNTVLSCIMNINYDHTEILGNTLEEIAFEKAGIIKNKAPVVCYPLMDEKALEVIKQKAKKENSQLIVADVSKVRYEKSDILKSRIEYENLKINLPFTGIHQCYNSLVVIKAMQKLRDLGYNIKDKDIIKGIEETKFSARIEVLNKQPLIIVDGAHNIDGVKALMNVLKENELSDFVCVWSSLSDKNPNESIKLIAPYISTIYITELFGKRKMSKEDLLEIAKEQIEDCHTCVDVNEAVKKALSHKDKKILIFGSLYLASDARKEVLKLI